MKKLLKVSAFLAAMMLALTFVACSSDDDEPSVVTTWNAEEGAEAMVLNFLDDSSFNVTMGELGTVAKGTYTGDTTSNGTIKVTITHMMGDNDELQALGNEAIEVDAKITNGKLPMNLPGSGEIEIIEFTKK